MKRKIAFLAARNTGSTGRLNTLDLQFKFPNFCKDGFWSSLQRGILFAKYEDGIPCCKEY